MYKGEEILTKILEKRLTTLMVFLLLAFISDTGLLIGINNHFYDDISAEKNTDNLQNELVTNNPIIQIEYENIFYDNSRIYFVFWHRNIRVYDVSIPKKTHREMSMEIFHIEELDFDMLDTIRIYEIEDNLAFAYMHNETCLFLKCYNITSEEVELVSSFSLSENISAIDTGYYNEQEEVLYLMTRYQNIVNGSFITLHEMLSFNLTDKLVPHLVNRYSIDTDITRYLLFHYDAPYAFLLKEHFFEVREIINSTFTQVHYTEDLYGILGYYWFYIGQVFARFSFHSNLLSISSVLNNIHLTYDIRDRRNPVLLNNSITSNFYASFFYQDTAFLLGANTFSIYNITPDNEFNFISKTQVIGQTEGKFSNGIINGNLLYLSKYTSTSKAAFYIYDINDLTKPKKLYPNGLIFGNTLKSERYRALFYTAVIALPALLSIATYFIIRRRKKSKLKINNTL